MAITDASAIGSARRTATQIAVEAGADETQAGRVAIVASELATNLVRHGGGGSLLMQVLEQPGQPVVELVALDSGAGMGDTSLCLSDGYSTRGTAGNGLGAVRRLSVFFDIYSQPGKGTVVVARLAVSARGALAPATSFELGAVSVALHGEPICGDGWSLVASGDHIALMVVDGLGHGLLAHEAALASATPSRAQTSPKRAPRSSTNMGLRDNILGIFRSGARHERRAPPAAEHRTFSAPSCAGGLRLPNPRHGRGPLDGGASAICYARGFGRRSAPRLGAAGRTETRAPQANCGKSTLFSR